MHYLLDTGILLRLVQRESLSHTAIRMSVRLLKQKGEVFTAFQNLCEFWNVCTRPETARGGFGLTLNEADRRLKVIERVVRILPDSQEVYSIWRELVLKHGVQGVQVHDAKIVAIMRATGISRILTLNPKDFSRYSEVEVFTPENVLQGV